MECEEHAAIPGFTAVLLPWMVELQENPTDIPFMCENMVGQLLTTALYVWENATRTVGGGASMEDKQDLQRVR